MYKMTTRKLLNVSEEVYNILMIQCKKEFLHHHKEFSGMRLSADFMLRKVSEYYVK